jgi:glycosyltransferase involved in cell wall biosynthesis
MSRVIAAGTFDRNFARNRRLITLLERAGHDVAVCQVDLFGSDKYELVEKGRLSMLARGAAAYPRLLWRFLRIARGDAVLILYPGWFDSIVLAPLARLRRMPVVFDIYISLFDTVVADRKIASERSVIGRVCKLVDRLSLRSAQCVIADTPEHAELYASLGGIARDRIGVVWVGADDTVFRPRPDIEPNAKRVLFYGTYIKLHGIDVIVRAAKLLENEGVEFRFIGTGQERAGIERLIEELDVSNIQLTDRVPLEDLPVEIASAAVCCGIFGSSEKAQRVVPNKVFECVAVGRPVVTADTPAMRRVFGDTEVALVPAGDPDALARVIRELLADPERRAAMAAAAQRHYLAAYATDSVMEQLENELKTAVSSTSSR